jgi:hypothetical protein
MDIQNFGGETWREEKHEWEDIKEMGRCNQVCLVQDRD